MLMIANVAILFLLSLFPSKHSGADPHDLMQIVNDSGYRQLLLDGRFSEYSSALDGALSHRFALELKAAQGGGKKIDPNSIRDVLVSGSRSDLTGLFNTIKSAIAVATFVTELQTLGPVKAMSQALNWVESGLIRRSGLRNRDFGSFFGIISHPDKARLDKDDLHSLDEDLSLSTGLMNSTYSRLFGKLTEVFF